MRSSGTGFSAMHSSLLCTLPPVTTSRSCERAGVSARARQQPCCPAASSFLSPVTTSRSCEGCSCSSLPTMLSQRPRRSCENVCYACVCVDACVDVSVCVGGGLFDHDAVTALTQVLFCVLSVFDFQLANTATPHELAVANQPTEKAGRLPATQPGKRRRQSAPSAAAS